MFTRLGRSDKHEPPKKHIVEVNINRATLNYRANVVKAPDEHA
jgi:hypothetical protein